MTRDDALDIRQNSKRMAELALEIAANERLYWGDRLKAMVVHDHCLELIDECDDYLRCMNSES